MILSTKNWVNKYGVYDVTNNLGWVNVGIDHDTASFAVESIRKWWYMMGCISHPDAKKILITADGGGSNGHRVRLWKTELQKLGDETGLLLFVTFPLVQASGIRLNTDYFHIYP